jgi:tetratricopeptide (TPR) repeat protein
VAQVPQHADELHLPGVLASQLARADVAIDMIGRAIAIDPASALYHGNLRENYGRSAQSDRATALLLRALELKPDHANLHIGLAQALEAAGRLDVAIEAFGRAAYLIARAEERYAKIAVAMTTDLKELCRIRADLRSRMQSSPLLDTRNNAADIERAFRWLWQAWCRQET